MSTIVELIDIHSLQAQTTLLTALFATAVLFVIRACVISSSSKNKDILIPRVPSYIPFLGSTLDYFTCLPVFCEKYREKFGDVFYATILGNDWLFLHNKQDFEKVIKSSEKQVSMYQAIAKMAGKFLPREFDSEYATDEVRKAVSRGNNWEGIPATPHFIYAMKPNKLRMWIPGMKETVTEHYFAAIPESGTMDLFDFCFQLISGMTARVLLGSRIAGNKNVLEEWVDLVRKAEPDTAFGSGPLSSFQATLEVATKGERSAYVRAREYIYPYIDAEIERMLAGEEEDADQPVVGALVRSYYKSYKENKEYLYASRKRLANDLFNFTFAAVTNSYGMAAWVIFHMLRNTEGVANTIKKELDESPPDADRFPNLEALILEIGRLYTPGSLMRLVRKDFVLPSTGQTIPAGTMTCTNVALLHRNADAFLDPFEFRPSRFQNDMELKKAGSSFVTFGAGMHPCTGRKFAIMEIALFVVKALEQFDFRLLEDDQRQGDPFTERYITNVPRHPKLAPAQNNSIWRPSEPVLIDYKRKPNSSSGSL